MASELRRWASIERQFIRDEIKWFDAGAKLTSPSGEDITSQKLDELKARLEHVQKAITEGDRDDA